MNNYHTLPCGTVIPPEGIEAWVRHSEYDEWYDETIIAYADGKVVTERKLWTWNNYTLTDPTKPKKRLVTRLELLGKYLHFETRTSLVIEVDEDIVRTKNHNYSVEFLSKECKGYSDTPTSEIKRFWVEEV